MAPCLFCIAGKGGRAAGKGTTFMRRTAGIVLLSQLTAGPLAPCAASAAAISSPGPERKQELLHMLQHDCGACHGLTLRGGLGPALLPEALAARSEDELVGTILDGRPGTPMPPWRPFLTEPEARWLVHVLRHPEAR
jgi:cytochrome c55X